MTGNLRLVSRFGIAALAAQRAAYAPASTDRRELLADRFILDDDGRHWVYYAPTDAFPSPNAEVIFVDCAPDFAQMQSAVRRWMQHDIAVRDVPGSGTEIATTSALTFPVFVGRGGTEFDGSTDLAAVPLFRRMLDELLAPRLQCAATALVIPLGAAAGSALRYLCDRRVIAANRVLWGMPHPSGSNTWRLRHFARDAGGIATPAVAAEAS